MFVTDTQLLQLSDRLSMEEQQIQGLSSRAINHLNVLVGQPGVWDIFVTKHVEVSKHKMGTFKTLRTRIRLIVQDFKLLC